MAARAYPLFTTLASACAWLAIAAPASADHEPVIALPGRAGVPVNIGCCDATGAIVYGDFGLYRPGHMAPFVEAGIPVGPAGAPGAYFPSTGLRPRLGRHEIEPRIRRRPANIEYHRSWFAGSRSGPVTDYPPFDPPPVIVAPRRK